MENEKIPKVIHYIWFGKNELPDIFDKCKKSWKKYCPDYKIKLWTEEDFDINMIPYCKEAYEKKKYAFVADYARLYILYNYGGIYLDIDVEFIKNIDELLENDCFMGFEEKMKVAPGLIIGAKKGNNIIKSVMEIYEKYTRFPKRKHDICKITTKYLKKHKKLILKNNIQYLDGITIYPKEYFCACDWITKKTNITKDTYCIHHYCGSWMNSWQRFKIKIRKLLRVYLYMEG